MRAPGPPAAASLGSPQRPTDSTGPGQTRGRRPGKPPRPNSAAAETGRDRAPRPGWPGRGLARIVPRNLSSAGLAPAANSPILPSASAAVALPRTNQRVGIVPGNEINAEKGPVGRLPIWPGLRRQPWSAMIQCLDPAGPHKAGRRPAGLADLAQCLHGLARTRSLPLVHRLDQSRRGLLGRRADGPPAGPAVWARTTLSGRASPSTSVSVAALIQRPEPGDGFGRRRFATDSSRFLQQRGKSADETAWRPPFSRPQEPAPSRPP